MEDERAELVTAEEMIEIGGIKIQARQMDAFGYAIKSFNNKEIAEKIGVAPATIGKWRKEPWWELLQSRYIEAKQTDFWNHMNLRNGEILEAYFKIINVADPYNKTAGAVIQAVKLYTELGKNPLLQKSVGTQITHNKNNILKIDQNDIKKIPREALLEAALTGEMPKIEEE